MPDVTSKNFVMGAIAGIVAWYAYQTIIVPKMRGGRKGSGQ